jgi:hypothetical protein
MKPNFELTPELLANEDRFNDPFFKQFKLRHAEAPLDLGEGISKNYLFPACYGDSSSAIGIFHCDYDAARALIPDERIEPVKMTRGRSLVIFSCYEYRNVLGIQPYNEVVMAIPVVAKGAMNIPVVTMLLGDRLKAFGYYVFHMPVTSQENRTRGHKIWGLPKEVERIDINNDNGHSVTQLFVDSENPYLTIRVPTGGATQHFDGKSSLYSYLEGDLLKSTTQFKGDYNVTKNMGTLLKAGQKSSQASLELGAGAIADKLRSLKIEEQAFQFRYAEHMNAVFDLAG